MPRIHVEGLDMSHELQRFMELLEADAQGASSGGEFAPPIDVIESADGIEVVADLPGLTSDQIHLVFSRGNLVVAGFKKPAVCRHADAAFHLAERGFGRFARVVRIAGAVDVGRARATLRAGELRVTVPRIADRRGGEIRIPIETA